MYKRPIQPLPEGMAESIGKTIDRLSYTKENLFETKQGSKEHLDQLLNMLTKEKPGSSDASQIKHAIEKMYGADKIPSKYKNAKPDMYEAKEMKGDDPCWDGYEMVGHKTKDGKKVPNCVKKESLELTERKRRKPRVAQSKPTGIRVADKVEVDGKTGYVRSTDGDECKVEFSKNDTKTVKKSDCKLVKTAGGVEVKESTHLEESKMGTITVDSDEDRKKRAAMYRAKKEKKNQHKLDETKYTKPKKGKTDDGKGLDPVGHADKDIDNDGDHDSSDEYLHARRKAIRKAMKKSDIKEEKMAGWIAMYNGKKVEIKKDEAKDLYGAKMKAAKELKVPKSKMGMLAIKPAYED